MTRNEDDGEWDVDEFIDDGCGCAELWEALTAARNGDE